ncbi:unnamed protein product [Didymodactylos carnosus]|uniref:Uncharacterized protein n=1 Tax=Didymodactylos carnosus TaxID=1234261 RepID=A0A815EHF7_9BILA|nr:unnamed protein product [Didymodactylos carnosus]CAF1311478.1 unnamed protein product [Didymodactylos carnosus]CAF1311495.1 unnamed protein product [Didymodactylos carnosus]CAF3903444.1 unnamed protein product [Didymodactylos carnosus]CAF4149336.1 unnamed protein product [Didymodactylos carnosus]
MIVQTCIYTTFNVDDFNINHQTLLKILIEYVYRYIQSCPNSYVSAIIIENPLPVFGLITNEILSVLSNLSDKTILIPYFISLGYSEIILKFLNVSSKINDEN